MRFSRLRLLGFKSFVEPAEFVIERGLTGVVGPNGCGKSNLVEALRWVMGESSYKNMRASGMDDVIFSGSATRPARNAAEVTLFLDNSDRTAPPSFNNDDELQVSRRIERASGSIYRINGKEARAKDVQLLFADQSTGARSPSMVGQGRIGELIQAKPQARRALLEEAAGISGLHTRRHEAELRLRAAEQNLERLDDVVGELGSQIENLKRQARQAQRFKNLSADIRKAEATLLHLRWTQAKEQAAQAQTVLHQATMVVATRAATQMEAAKQQGIGAHHLPTLRDAAAAALATVQRLELAKAQMEDEARRLRERQAELARRLEQLTGDLAREEQLGTENTAALARLDEEEAVLQADHDGADLRERQSHEALEQGSAALSAAEAALGEATTRRAEVAAQRAELDRALRAAQERLQRLSAQAADIQREAEALNARMRAAPDVEDAKRAVAAAETESKQAESVLAQAEHAVVEARREESEARAPLGDAKAALAAIETEARTLTRVLNAGHSQDFPPVLDQIEVERGYEAALGAALGDDLDLPLHVQAPAFWGDAPFRSDDPNLPVGIVSLAQHVKAPRQLGRRLAQIGLVTADDGARRQSELAPGQRLVTSDGALWRWDGYRASADAPTAAAQRLAQKNRLAELDAELQLGRATLTDAEQSAQAADASLKQAVNAEREARDALRRLQQETAKARDVLLRAERAAADLAARQAAIGEASARINDSRSEAERALADASDAMGTAPELSALDADLDASRAVAASKRTHHADLRAAVDTLRREAEMRTRRLGAIANERRAWRDRSENAGKQLVALEARRADAQAEQSTLFAAPEELDTRRRSLNSELAQAETTHTHAADALKTAEIKQLEFDRAATTAIAALSEARETRGRAEERVTAADDRRLEIEARINEALGVPPHKALAHAGIAEADALPTAAEVEQRLERFKSERDRLGAVNLRADEEQRELTDRLNTLVKDRDDVVEAIRMLRQAIHGLNREGRERLLAAFEVVNGQFQRLFTHLFGGGEAELQLIESDDPLNAGLEIVARPPGKKPQTMTLLSGGEQALTAMALIFAVFLTNPAPICVLDEVDAPLDDHNVERFCNLMDEMAASTDTRFVVITHNPITMARMNRLFGVTMAEQGVSQLVSVDLQTAEQIAEAV
ncbi:chromosome segregation protein SMC [Tianweitania sp. BSSL-BM11]|uniref:Chromosome partition protein Smc n=1 Tax=Tianweitania aestuarii TaxID=2814886 RepID=A0ABS5RU75_9HYPH|nr:chromosome segregation protein SMC [Tianweitania aestuarii]MBS9719804.1 chromosome segregation protein SMC [Tianweitania aestuarii]